MEENRRKYDEAISQITQPGAAYEVIETSYDGINYRAFKHAPKTMAELYAPAREYGDKEFLVYEGERWSFADLFKQADEIGYQLIHKLDAKKGDRVAIAMRNLPEWMSAYIAITSIGAVAVPVNSWGKAKELEYTLVDAGAAIVFCDQQRLDYLSPCLLDLDIQAVVARPEHESLPKNAQSIESFVAGAESKSMPEVAIDEEDMAMILYTSGTTGKPKGGVSKHRNVCQSIIDLEATGAALAMANPVEMGSMMEKGFAPKSLLAVPLFHVSGLHAQFLSNLRGGRCLVMMYKWDVDKACEYIVNEKITTISAAPAMIGQLMESEQFSKIDTHSLFGIGGGGSASPPKLAGLIFEKLPDAFPGTGWGMTETNAIASSFSGSAFAYKPHSAGFIHPVVDLQFTNEEGREVDALCPGEIWVKSPSNIQGYWNKPDVNAREFKDGWFKTGDIGYMDGEGYLIICDRAKDMVIRGGENIYPAEIEGLIASYPGVIEVAAFGISDPELGEKLAVLVTKDQTGEITADAIKAFVGDNLAKFKIPSLVKFTVENLPRNAAGKLLKKDVKAVFLSL